jgi:hypothetical protein
VLLHLGALPFCSELCVHAASALGSSFHTLMSLNGPSPQTYVTEWPIHTHPCH